MPQISKIHAREILDSRGYPTIEVDILSNDHFARAAVPSGASTGTHEAVELRDGDTKRFKGKGVLNAVQNVNDIIAPEIQTMDIFEQKKIDLKMIEIDGTKNKGKLGANAILGVSLAVAKIVAKKKNIPLYTYFAEIAGINSPSILPVPMMNIVNGGKHSDAGLSIQEFMIVPKDAPSFKEAVRSGSEIFHTLKTILKKKGYVTAVGDEGGFAPHIETHEEVLEIIMEAIKTAGYEGKIKIALDAAASEFYENGSYKIGHNYLSSEELVDYYESLISQFPIISIEDSHAEDDFFGFSLMNEKFGNSIQLVGDDLFVTNTERISLGIKKKLANAVLIKLNQIGTVTETIDAITLANKVGWNSIISHRSGETEDTTIADFAVGLGTGQIKTGSLSRTDRICKYNQLLRIEEELSLKARFGL